MSATVKEFDIATTPAKEHKATKLTKRTKRVS
jgi:hypothetical protein